MNFKRIKQILVSPRAPLTLPEFNDDAPLTQTITPTLGKVTSSQSLHLRIRTQNNTGVYLNFCGHGYSLREYAVS